VVQKYLRFPYLIDGLKFDLRIYVLVTSVDPLKIFIYEEGMARFATEPYDLTQPDTYDNLLMHLTNYAINKKAENFEGESEEGHKRTL